MMVDGYLFVVPGVVSLMDLPQTHSKGCSWVISCMVQNRGRRSSSAAHQKGDAQLD